MPSESKLSWDQYLKLAAIPYAFGFLTVMFHTARYGFPVIQVLQPLNFWIGMIPTLIVLTAIGLIRWAIDSPWEQPAINLTVRLGVPLTLTLAVVLIFFSAVLDVLALADADMRSYDVSLRFVIVTTIISISLCVAYGLIAAVARIKKRLDTTMFGVQQRLPTVMIAIVSALVFTVFLRQIYPALPQRYGFGKPADVKLILDPRLAPVELFEAKPSNVFPTVSRSVKLLYRTDKEDLILCDACASKSISITNAAVLGVVWERPSSPAPKK